MNPVVLITGLTVCLLAGLVLVFFTVAPSPPRVARDRRVAPGTEHVPLLTRVTEQTTADIESATTKRRARLFGAEELELAGVKSTPTQYVVLVASSASMFALLGVVLGLSNGTSILWGIIFAILVPVVAKTMLIVRTSRLEEVAGLVDERLRTVDGRRVVGG